MRPAGRAGDRHVVSGESCEDGARAYEGFEQQEDGGNYGEGQETGQFVSEADRFDEQPYTEQQGHARKWRDASTLSRWRVRGPRGRISPWQRGQSRPQPAPDPVALTTAPCNMTITLTDRVIQARRGAFIGVGLPRLASKSSRKHPRGFLNAL